MQLNDEQKAKLIEALKNPPAKLSNNLNAVGELVNHYGFEVIRQVLERTLDENCFADLPPQTELRLIRRGSERQGLN